MSLKVFGSNDLNQAICGFLNANERVNLSMVDRDCHTNVRAFEKEERTLLAYRQVFAVAPTRELIFSCLSTKDLVKCNRVNRAYKKNISSFQPRQILPLIPTELQEVVKRATFQNMPIFLSGLNLRWGNCLGLRQEGFSASVSYGFAREVPYVACKMNVIFSETLLHKTVLIVAGNLLEPDWRVYGYSRAGYLESLPEFAEFIKTGKLTFEHSTEGRKNCCVRICDLFRRIFCGITRPKELFPQFRLA